MSSGSVSKDRLGSSGPEPFEACPDGGRCWHGCPLETGPEHGPEGKGLPCWRVLHASPFSVHGERWTPEERAKHFGDGAAIAETDIVKVRAAAMRLRRGQWRLDVAIADLLDALAARYDEVACTFPDGSEVGQRTAAETVTGWQQAVNVAKIHIGEF